MDYISRAALMGELTSSDMQQKIKDMTGAEAYNEFLAMVNGTEKADVAEVRHGHWINASIKGVSHYRCTECGEYIEAVWTANFDYRYCPNCGARMDGGADNAV